MMRKRTNSRCFGLAAAFTFAVLVSQEQQARADEKLLHERVATLGGSALSTSGWTGGVTLKTGLSYYEYGQGVDYLVVASVFVCKRVCDGDGCKNVCDSGSASIPWGPLDTPGVGALWMDPLLQQASFTITVPSFDHCCNRDTLTASVTFTGRGTPKALITPPDGVFNPATVPAGVTGNLFLSREATVAGTVSSTALDHSDTFAGDPKGLIGHFVSEDVTVPPPQELCDLVGSESLSPGVNDSNPAGRSHFTFSGTLSNCRANANSNWIPPSNGAALCANGLLTDATCSGNVTYGWYAACPVGATCDAIMGMSAVPSCTSGSSLVEPLFSGEIQGVCVGPSCDGGSSPPNPPHGILYSLLFDQATIENMGEVCPSGGNLTSASFSGTVSLAP